MSVDIRQSLNCLRFPSRYESVSKSGLSNSHTGDCTREAENHNCSGLSFIVFQVLINLTGTLTEYLEQEIMEQISSNPNPSTMEKKRNASPCDLSEVRTSNISEYKATAQCLAEAFAIDEVARYFIDTEDMSAYSEEYKWKLHCDILRYAVAAHCYNGIVTTIGPNYDAVALWFVHPDPVIVPHPRKRH
jgi:hypothetical protein